MTDPDSLPVWAPRQAALLLEILEQVVEAVREGHPADRTLHGILSKQRKFGSRDRRLIGDAVFAWFRWHGATADLPYPQGLCAAWALERREWPAALQAILQDLGWPMPSSDQTDTPLDQLREDIQQQFGIALTPMPEWLPDWFREETTHLGDWTDRIQEHTVRPPTWLRVDQSRQQELHPLLLEKGAEWAEEASPCAYAFAKPGVVNQLMREHGDALEIQDFGSQQVARICNPQSGQTWWDACCGAGGKSLQLLDLAERNLDLTCTDKRESVLKELVKRGRQHGTGKVRRYALDLLNPPQLPNIVFDGILLDAPCTGTGTWNRNPDDAWRTERKDVSQQARRQLQMIETVLPVLKSGGSLVYAVCSITRTETEQVVEEALKQHPNLELSPFSHPLTGEQTTGTMLLLPSQTNGDGMFVAKFVKKD